MLRRLVRAQEMLRWLDLTRTTSGPLPVLNTTVATVSVSPPPVRTMDISASVTRDTKVSWGKTLCNFHWIFTI